MNTMHYPGARRTEPAHHSISSRLAIVLQRAGTDRRGRLARLLRRERGVDHVQVLTLQRPDWDALAWGGLPTRRALGVLALARLCRPDLIVVAAGGGGTGHGFDEPEARQGLQRVADVVRARSGDIEVHAAWLNGDGAPADAQATAAGMKNAARSDAASADPHARPAWLAHHRWEDDGGRTVTGRDRRPGDEIRGTGRGRVHRRFAEHPRVDEPVLV